MELESFEQDSNTIAYLEEIDQDMDKLKVKILNQNKHYEDKILELKAEIRNLQKELENKENLIHEQVDIIKNHQKREDVLKRALQNLNRDMIQENLIKLENISRSNELRF
jgi:hypothetical protein